MARDILSVPVSTVSSESCFSLTGRIIEERRRCLSPETVEMLICLKDWELGEKRERHDVKSWKTHSRTCTLMKIKLLVVLLLLSEVET